MAKRFTYGDVTFGSFLAKEHWILEMNIRSLEFLRDHGHVTGQGAMVHMKSVIKTMKAQERRIRKQLVKDGYLLK
jgi:hypothetical protein